MSDERFRVHGETVKDMATGLVWPIRGRFSATGLTWAEAFDFVAHMNRELSLGFDDWRLPNRRELYSLIDHAASRPALPAGHPFQDVWHGWCWTSTTSARATGYAWWVQLAGGRMFYGKKTEDAVVWPVRGASRTLFVTGQTHCYDAAGKEISCPDTGQDGEMRNRLNASFFRSAHACVMLPSSSKEEHAWQRVQAGGNTARQHNGSGILTHGTTAG